MTKRNGLLRRGLVALAGLATICAAAAAATQQRAAPPAALAKLQAGLWQLRDLDQDKAEHPPVCLGDPALLVQLRHRDSACARRVVAQGPESATVHYTCPASGFGQTVIRVETPRLAQIETQGIARNVPFASRIEARRVGSCGPINSNR